MAKKVSITEAAEATGLSVASLRRGVKSGRFPAIRAGSSETGKLLFDIARIEQRLEQEAFISAYTLSSLSAEDLAEYKAMCSEPVAFGTPMTVGNFIRALPGYLQGALVLIPAPLGNFTACGYISHMQAVSDGCGGYRLCADDMPGEHIDVLVLAASPDVDGH